MEPEVIQGIPKSQAIKWLLSYLIVGGVLVFLAQTLLFPWVKDYLSVSDKIEALRRFKVVMFGFGVSLVPFAVSLALPAWRIIKSRQFPHPGARVLRDTPIVRGWKALLRGWILLFGVLWLLACAAYAAYIPYLLAASN